MIFQTLAARLAQFCGEVRSNSRRFQWWLSVSLCPITNGEPKGDMRNCYGRSAYRIVWTSCSTVNDSSLNDSRIIR